MAPVLAYWKIRGLAQPIRLMLAYTDTEFEDKLYEQGEAPEYDKSCWFDVKFTLGLDFPNLPYYIDGDSKITQSTAIMTHIARKYDPTLLGVTDQEKDSCDMVSAEICDFRSGFTRICYNPNFETLKVDYLKNLPNKLKQFSDYLGSKKWIAGEHMTYPDFMLYEMLDQHLILTSTCLDEFQNLKDYHKKFQEIPQIKKYMSSSKFMKGPLNNKFAQFGNK